MVRATGHAGFTLSEVMISLAISSTVIMAVLGLTTTHLTMASASNNRGAVSSDLIAINDFFTREVLNSGGEYLPVWAAIAVENKCGPRASFPDCKGADRLTLIKPTTYLSCQVKSSTASTLTFDPVSCCLNTLDLNHFHVMVIQNGNLAQKYVTGVNIAACSASVTTGPLAFQDTQPVGYDWSTATVLPVQIQTYYLNKTTNELSRVTYLNQGADQKAVIDSPVIDRVMDFQVALGFDFAPEDGVCTDTNNDKDEWLYNNPGGGEALGQGKFLGVTPMILKMVNVTTTLGAPSNSPIYKHTIKALDGPAVTDPNMMMDVGSVKLLLRSLRTFQ